MRRGLIMLVLLMAAPLSAGGISGGGGVGAIQAELNATVMALMQPDLDMKKMKVSIDDFRRTRARLSVIDETEISIESETVRVKKLGSAITDVSEIRQLVVEI